MIHKCDQMPSMFAGLDQRTAHLVAAGSMHCVCLTGMTALSLHKLHYAAFMLYLVLFSMNVNIHIMEITKIMYWKFLLAPHCPTVLHTVIMCYNRQQSRQRF